MSTWGLDLGTTNTGLARWNADARRADLVELPAICRKPGASLADALGAPRLVPSATDVRAIDTVAWLGRLPVVRDLVFLGNEATIGRPALQANEGWPGPSFCPSWKGLLARDPRAPAARVGDEVLSAREVARRFVRELFAEVQRTTGERVRTCVVTVPVASYDTYRAELRAILAEVGVRAPRFVDEPVAAAMGYGLGLDRPREVLVVDIGGGTLHVVRATLQPRAVEAGTCEVRAKEGRPVGGNLVDRWVLEDLCAEAGLPLDPAPADETEVLWQRLLVAEARRVKEAVHLEDEATFTFVAPEELRGGAARLPGLRSIPFTRERLGRILEQRGFYALLDECVDAAAGDVDEVLLVGGSTLLPGVYPRLEQRFGRDRVRGWQPFEAVATGAASFGAGGWAQLDTLVHDYALLTHDRATGQPGHTLLIPRGTRFPTAPDHWRRQLVPTCSLGEPERQFRLVVVEIGRHGGDGARFGWDESGALRPMVRGSTDVIVPLNANNPALGVLDPPHPPDDRQARLDVAFGVDEDRWLVATVRDLRTGRLLMQKQAVARLL